ncbi:hypothetical protein GCM10010211_77740 [Streptomyces albospinus]|uniref:Uncharacterized protein n=1 Tax=Streptomyces albospinus TaxID=285515 RepID=A0ABQ2VMY1_9ACTN|nr:hypothetical protein [Streptomyces albospinus]GGU98771.1 hypothetical protein GCM10010211_77740 [Streptomyces albospinus]
MSADFPPDLISVQAELAQAKADHAELYAALPWSAEALEGWDRSKETGGGYYASHRPDSAGRTDAPQQHVAELRARVLAMAERVVTHEFWSLFDDAPAARSALKHTVTRDSTPS